MTSIKFLPSATEKKRPADDWIEIKPLSDLC
jgi:hypothetical protein